MAVAFGIYPLHLRAEEFAVGGGVAKLVVGDVIMDHLMEDGVADEVFRKIEAGVDTENEVLVAQGPEEPRAAAGEGDFTKESTGIGEFDTNRGKGTGKETGVVLVKTGLDVWDGRNHGAKVQKNFYK